eukprot:m.93441 g.93441  ORF g.93441 m.93441 type:complete len:296 (+) comp13401_c0_seq7:2009-2896(+)
MSSDEREAKTGLCLAGLQASEFELLDYRGQQESFVYKFVRHPSYSKPLQGAFSLSKLSVSDLILVSLNEGARIAIASGKIKDISDTEIIIRANGPIKLETEEIFRLDKDFSMLGKKSVMANLSRLFVSPDTHEHSNILEDDRLRMQNHRDMIVDLKAPKFAPLDSMTTQIITNAMNESSLNAGQQKAIFGAVSAQNYSLMLGMPGTGKTKTISKLVMILKTLGKSVLVTSYTHSAVDNILLKLKVDEFNFDFTLKTCSRIIMYLLYAWGNLTVWHQRFDHTILIRSVLQQILSKR